MTEWEFYAIFWSLVALVIISCTILIQWKQVQIAKYRRMQDDAIKKSEEDES